MSNPISNFIPGSSDFQNLWFRRGDQCFSLRMPELIEVTELPRLRVLPMADAAIAGFARFRGHILPVFDPLCLAGLPGTPVQFPVKAVFASLGGRPAFGLLLDEVGRMVSLLAGGKPWNSKAGVRDAFHGEYAVPGGPVVLGVDVAGLAGEMQLAA
jgi:hypothetical protein